MTRREAISRLFGKRPAVAATTPADGALHSSEATALPGETLLRVAVVSARQCIALPPGFCRACVERCPLPGAMAVRNGVPMVNAAICDGCGLCAEICPAPRKAILMLPRRENHPIPYAS